MRAIRSFRFDSPGAANCPVSQQPVSKHVAVIQPVVASGAGETIKGEFELSKAVLAYIDRKAAKETTH